MIKNIPWNPLKKGDIIDIIAPSSGVSTEDLINYYEKVKKLFSRYDLTVRIPNDLIDYSKNPFSSNSLDYRTNHLVDALTNGASKAIWAIRGGYGAAKLLSRLKEIDRPITNKLLLGFSDITALHLFFENKWNFSTIHAPVINQLISNENLLKELEPIIFGREKIITYNKLSPLNEAAKEEISISATITGGNLSLVQTSLATFWEINAKDKIIFLEEVHEQGYRIDRMLNHLNQAGIFKEAKAIIFGEITPQKDISPDLCPYAIKSFASEMTIPVVSLPMIGHDIFNNSPLPLGTECKLTLGETPSLTCNTGAI